MLCEYYQEEIDSHREWLRSFGAERLRKWEQLLSAQEEPAIVEACTRHFLGPHVDRIEPAEDRAQGGPDFRCFRGGSSYYVEVTCITRCVLTAKTELPDDLKSGARFYGLLAQQVLQECKNKAPQCSALDAPCLLAIGTLHCRGRTVLFPKLRVEEILTSETKIRMRFDYGRGETIGGPIQTTDLQNAAFCRKGRNPDREIELARQSISGLLLCAFGLPPVTEVRGVLHPCPKRPFDRRLLPDVEFCKLEGYDTGELRPRWV